MLEEGAEELGKGDGKSLTSPTALTAPDMRRRAKRDISLLLALKYFKKNFGYDIKNLKLLWSNRCC
jgi:hypothetical protein